MNNTTTICALASSVGKGGVGVMRVSGGLSRTIAKKMLGFAPKARYAHYGSFFDQNKIEIDKGIALFFPAPHSFTGEDVIEFQGHGGISVMQALIKSAIKLGAVIAEPGEFSKRAFLNGKMDLVQAEAVADIIDASSQQAVRGALKSLSGEFSKQINTLTKTIIELRVFVEASIDFTDEEIDFLHAEQVTKKIQDSQQKIKAVLKSAQQGAILREGLDIAIAGRPNAGKSSLLNALTQQPSAIVTDIAGTTRDVLRETIHIKGMPLNIIDTAGLHKSDNLIEKEGIKRAHAAIKRADVVLLMYDGVDGVPDLGLLPDGIDDKSVLLIKNKIDLTDDRVGKTHLGGKLQLSISAKHNSGVGLLKETLADIAGLDDTTENIGLARQRHITALKHALADINHALIHLESFDIALMAQDLRYCGQHLGSITGEFSNDDLLGEIFSLFCIGK